MNLRRVAKIACLKAFLMLPPMLGWAAEWAGSVGLETRVFEESAAFEGQKDGPGSALIFEPEFYHEWNDGRALFEAIAYGRWDSEDGQRSLLDLRELSLLFVNGNWETRVGISKVFWGVAESQHLVDTINQTDLAANPDGEDKLGQPMINVVYVSDVGDFGLFLLPGFRERTFPGREGRLRGELWVDADNALYESSGGDERVDLALRWKHYIGAVDVGAHYFKGTNRNPYFVPSTLEDGELVLLPYYELMDQVGIDLQLTKGGWLWKLEALGRESERDRYSAMVGGFEYTFYGLGGSALDLGVLAEAHLDSRGERAPVAFNRDLFLGGRLTWNDDADTSLVAGAFVDGDNGSTIGRIEWSRRLRGGYTLEIEGQKLTNMSTDDPFFEVRRDSYVQLSLTRYF